VKAVESLHAPALVKLGARQVFFKNIVQKFDIPQELDLDKSADSG